MMKTQSKQKRRIVDVKKRFLFLNIAAIVFLLTAINHIALVGDDYNLNTEIFAKEFAAERVEIDFSTQGILELTGFHTDDSDRIIAGLHSLSAGETDAVIRVIFTDGSESFPIYSSFRVSNMGTVIENGRGMVNFSGFMLLFYLLLIYLGMALGVTIFSFIECLKKRQYSYRMIAYGGIALYLGTLLTILVYKLLNDVIGDFSRLLYLISSTGEWLLLFMLVPMALSALAVSFSNIQLMRREGFRPVNALGIAVSVVWLLSLIGIVMIDDFRISLYDGYEETEFLTRLMNALEYAAVFLITYFESMLISTSLCAFSASRHAPPLDRDCIIILGCAIRRDGTLTPLLRGRVDSALDFEKKQFETTGRHAVFVPSGGQGPDEIMSEGEAMENYLLSRGVEPGRILREGKSVNTYENMRFSKEVIEEACGSIDDKKIAFATTNYHVFRGYILSKKNGFDAQGISAKTKWYFFPNAFLREFIGLLVDQKLRHIAVILCFVLVSVAFALIL